MTASKHTFLSRQFLFHNTFLVDEQKDFEFLFLFVSNHILRANVRHQSWSVELNLNYLVKCVQFIEVHWLLHLIN